MTDPLTVAVAIANLLGILGAGVAVTAYTRVQLAQILETLKEIAARLKVAEERFHDIDRRLVRIEEWRTDHRIAGTGGK